MSRPFFSRCALRVAAVASALLLAGCFGPQKKGPNTEFAERNWQIRQSTLAAVQSFQLKGRLAESGLTGARGDLNWTQSGERFDVRVSGPLGVGALAISGDPRSVEIRTKDGVFVTDSPESFMQQRLGWSLPLRQLHYWVLGELAPLQNRDGEATRFPTKLLLDDAGRASVILQSDWKVAYEEYQVIRSLTLPRKFTMASGDRSFRIVIDEWSGTP